MQVNSPSRRTSTRKTATPTPTPVSAPVAPQRMPEATGESTFRNLYTRVLLSMQAQEHPVLGVTSAIDGEGKTTIAAGLAASIAEDAALRGFGREPDTTLFVACNDGTPPADPRLAVHQGPGLIQVLRGEADLDAVIQGTGVDGLSILPLGEARHNFPLAIRAATLPDVITQLRSRFGLIVLDLPAVLNSTDTQVLSRLADQVVLVVRAGVTPAKMVRQALDELSEDTVLGVVLNDSQADLPSWLEHRL
jgi:Mrp family chromosome partitioning ATPase